MQDGDAPGSLDMSHQLALSMTPPEPPAVPQTVHCGTPSALPEAGHPPHHSVPIQLSPQVQPLSQSLSEKAGSEDTLPKLIAIQPKTQMCSSSKESGVTKRPSTTTSEPTRATSSTGERPAKKIKKGKPVPGKHISVNPYGSSEAVVFYASKRKSPTEAIFDVAARLAKTIEKEPDVPTKNQLRFFCLCKLLHAMGVSIYRLQGLKPEWKYDSSFEKLFDGVVWANRLLEGLPEERLSEERLGQPAVNVGQSAVDSLLNCKSRSRRCIRGAR